MNLKLLKLLLLTLVVNMSVSQTSIAEDACTPVVKACDKALADQDRVIDLKGKAIEAQAAIIAAQDTRISSLEKEKGGLLSSPWLYLTVGLVVGGYLVRSK